MIISVSRRTDIPAFYAEWFMNRINEQFVLVRNPLNYHQVSRISLSKDVVDFIVFWTKNAVPLMKYIPEIAVQYPFYFQYTLNAYDRSIEPGVQPLGLRIEKFQHLSSLIGKEKVIWRYDPILISEQTDVSWHVKQFEEMASALKGFTERCVFSFIDLYEKVVNNTSGLGIRACNTDEMNTLAREFADIAKDNQMNLVTCAEEIDLSRYGIQHGHCVDEELISRIGGFTFDSKKDKNQREICGCIESIDIGQYNTCRHGCRYCYANFSPKTVATLSAKHDPKSRLLIGDLEKEDIVTERKMKSLKTGTYGQVTFFDF